MSAEKKQTTTIFFHLTDDAAAAGQLSLGDDNDWSAVVVRTQTVVKILRPTHYGANWTGHNRRGSQQSSSSFVKGLPFLLNRRQLSSVRMSSVR